MVSLVTRRPDVLGHHAVPLDEFRDEVDGSGGPAIGMAVDKILQFAHLPFGSTKEHVSEPASTGQAEDQPSWAEIVRHAEHGESVSVIAHGDHVAEIVPSGETREPGTGYPDRDHAPDSPGSRTERRCP